MGMKNWEHFHPRSHRVSRTGVVWWIWMCSCERNDISFYLRQSLNFCSNFSCLHFGWWRNFLAGSKCLQLVMRWCQFSCFLSFPPRPACKIDYLFFFLSSDSDVSYFVSGGSSFDAPNLQLKNEEMRCMNGFQFLFPRGEWRKRFFSRRCADVPAI